MARERMYAEALRQQPSPEMLGTGTAAAAGKDSVLRPKYNRYAAEAMMEGSAPKTYEQWKAEQGK